MAIYIAYLQVVGLLAVVAIAAAVFFALFDRHFPAGDDDPGSER